MSQPPVINDQASGFGSQGPDFDPRTLLAQRLQLPGQLRKRLRVPDHHIAIVLAETGPQPLGPGDHSLPNWPWPAPEVILVDTGPLALDLQWDGLPSGDGDPVTAIATVSVRVADPLRLHADWLRLGAGPAWGPAG